MEGGDGGWVQGGEGVDQVGGVVEGWEEKIESMANRLDLVWLLMCR